MNHRWMVVVVEEGEERRPLEGNVLGLTLRTRMFLYGSGLCRDGSVTQECTQILCFGTL